jgi:hypothetical protein
LECGDLSPLSFFGHGLSFSATGFRFPSGEDGNRKHDVRHRMRRLSLASVGTNALAREIAYSFSLALVSRQLGITILFGPYPR